MSLSSLQVATPERVGRPIDPAKQRTRCRRCRLFHVDGFCAAMMEMPAITAPWQQVIDPICRNTKCPCPAHATAELALLNVYADGWHLWHLSPTETALLAALLPPWRDVSRFELLTRVWGANVFASEDGRIESHLLGVNIARLRRKLGPGLKIATVLGIGYRLVLTSVPEP